MHNFRTAASAFPFRRSVIVKSMHPAGTEQPSFQFTLRRLMASTAAVAMVFGVASFVHGCLSTPFFGPKQPGIVENKSEWPDSLRELLDNANKANVQVDQVRVFALDKRPSFNCHSYWQLSESPELLALIAKRWPVNPATKSEVDWFWRDMPDGWAPVGTQSNRRYFAKCGEKGDNIVVMTDEPAKTIYARYQL